MFNRHLQTIEKNTDVCRVSGGGFIDCNIKIQLCTTNTVLTRVKRITKIQFMGYKCPSNKHDSLVSSESEV